MHIGGNVVGKVLQRPEAVLLGYDKIRYSFSKTPLVRRQSIMVTLQDELQLVHMIGYY